MLALCRSAGTGYLRAKAMRSETKRVDDFAAMSDEELRAYVYGTKDEGR